MKYTELADNEEFYHKVEYYNKARTEKLSYHYKEILKLTSPRSGSCLQKNYYLPVCRAHRSVMIVDLKIILRFPELISNCSV